MIEIQEGKGKLDYDLDTLAGHGAPEIDHYTIQSARGDRQKTNRPQDMHKFNQQHQVEAVRPKPSHKS